MAYTDDTLSNNFTVQRENGTFLFWISLRWSTRVLYSFKAALDCNSLYRIIFDLSKNNKFTRKTLKTCELHIYHVKFLNELQL